MTTIYRICMSVQITIYCTILLKNTLLFVKHFKVSFLDSKLKFFVIFLFPHMFPYLKAILQPIFLKKFAKKQNIKNFSSIFCLIFIGVLIYEIFVFFRTLKKFFIEKWNFKKSKWPISSKKLYTELTFWNL